MEESTINTKYQIMIKDGKKLYHIKALKDIGTNIHKGDIGGYIEKEENLSMEGTAWVSNKAQVFGDAQVVGDVNITGNACIGRHAYIEHSNDYVCIGPIGINNSYITFYKTRNKTIYVYHEGFNGPIRLFKSIIKEKHENDEYEKKYLQAILGAKKFLS